jgi:hypothetical protein
MKTVFLSVLEADDKAAALLAAIHEPQAGRATRRFEVSLSSLASIPGQPFAYWLSDTLLHWFRAGTPLSELGVTTKVGLGTLDDFRFLRAWWEVAPDGDWAPFVKGSGSVGWYADLSSVLAWANGGHELKQFVEQRVGSASRKIQAQSFYRRPGLTWSRRPHKRGWFRFAPAGAVFADNGPMAFGDQNLLADVLALLNSVLANHLMQTMMSRGRGGSGQTLTYEVGVVDNLPLPIGAGLRGRFGEIGRRAWSLRRALDTCNDTSHAFTVPALLQVEGKALVDRVARWAEHVRSIERELATIQSKVDDLSFDLYRVNEGDRWAIIDACDGASSESTSNETDDGADSGANGEPDRDADEADGAAVDATRRAAELVSWTIGVAFGRFDVCLTAGARQAPAEPEPFDPLPPCSPGMLTGGEGLPVARPPTGYPIAFPEAGVLVDDLGHGQDLSAAVRAVFDAVFGADAERWWNDVAALLDRKGHDLRVWLGGSFFEHHLRYHSRSRRKAPILWQFGTLSGRYSVWLYAHRLTRDSFFQLQNEVVGPKLTHEDQKLTSLIQDAGGSPSAPERKEIAAQEAVVEELRAMLEEVTRVAPLWSANLDDGVVLTMAPLWRLVPQCKPWQKELKTKWDELSAGKYEWAHLAMHLWPERVVPKCATDRSLAIAHGLETEFWIEGEGGKWRSRTPPLTSVGALVRERSSPAVKAALKSLLEAPASVGNGRVRGRRAAPPAATDGGRR